MQSNPSEINRLQQNLRTQNESALFAEIIIPLNLPQNYTWSIPVDYHDKVSRGLRVEVELRNKKYAGVIKNLHHNKPVDFSPKPILNLIDEVPLVSDSQLAFWQWMARYYMCSEGDVMNAAMPANLKLSSESILIFDENKVVDPQELSDEEFIVAEALEVRKELKLSEVQQILDARYVYPVVRRLIEKNVCYIWEELKKKYSEKTETYVLLSGEYEDEEKLKDLLNNWSKAPKQLELLLSYLHFKMTDQEVIQSQLLKKAGANLSQLKGLIDKGILIAEKRVIGRLRPLKKQINIDFSLSEAQQTAMDEIEDSFKIKQVCLLDGVTGSGKTLIYVKLIEEILSNNQQVLYLLPEIALTAQVIRRLQSYFGGNIAIYHSRLNSNERVEIWNKVKSNDIRIVLGARSSLFLPFENLGLIIVDEEHDSSYKQIEPAPRYHARDSAIYYASLNNAKVLLGSGTPSIESYFNARHDKYGYVELKERYGASQLPETVVIDMKPLSGKFKKVLLSPQLQSAIEQTLSESKQVILFQNRRGYTPYIICSVCGWIPQCMYCDVSLTYHKFKNNLSCHYCGTNYPVVKTCAACGSHQFMQKNFGTEKIEELLISTFPNVNVGRMDYDSVKGKHDHEKIIRMFEQQETKILVGTQMVVKGLDFEHVDLVGILDADGLLNFADFRVNERAFQLMEQVSGRAGRKNDRGKVYIQVSNTHHPVLQFVKEHDYNKLYNFEIENRKAFFYPPFSRLIKLIFRHRLSETTEAASYKMKSLLSEFQQYLAGPAEPVINRVRNQYIWELLIKLPKDQALQSAIRSEIQSSIVEIQSTKSFRQVGIVVDVDPV